MHELVVLPPAMQADLPHPCYDSWRNPAGEPVATFHRLPEGFLLRLIDQADFAIYPTTGRVTCTPEPHLTRDAVETLWHNAIQPLIINHDGGLALHGSAVVIDGRAVAFVGPSRRGKSTLAAAFARAGHPFLTEDVLELVQTGDGYRVLPHRPLVRVFADTARFLAGQGHGAPEPDDKRALLAGDLLPFAEHGAMLHGLYILGPGDADQPVIVPVDRAAALAALMAQSFILDVEDGQRLRGHFGRIADLAAAVPCHQLDYPRRYDQLPGVIAALVGAVEAGTRDER